MGLTGIIVLAVLAVVVIYFVMIYNQLVQVKHNVSKAWANIDVLLKQRHDELPKLIETCKQYMKFEQDTLQKVIDARSRVFSARESQNIPALGTAEAGLRASVGSLFALAEQQDVPRIFGRIHPTFRTPDVAIVFTCLSTLALALSGTFASLAAVSAVARLVIYSGTCASVLALRRQGRAPFTIPGGPIVPGLALAVCLTILWGATSAQLQAGGQALLVGAVLFLIARVGAKGTGK